MLKRTILSNGNGSNKGKVTDLFSCTRLRMTLLLLVLFTTALFSYQGLILVAVQVIEMDTECLATGATRKDTGSVCYLDCAHTGKTEYLNIVWVTLGDVPGKVLAIPLLHYSFTIMPLLKCQSQNYKTQL